MSFLSKPLAQAVYQSLLNTPSKNIRRILMHTRNILLRFCNPLITAKFNGFTLTMPFSHTIFINQKLFPHYDMRLRDIAECVRNKHGKLAMIDVGANIGDTAVFTNIANARYLLIEGEKSYANLIRTNLMQNFTAPVHFTTSNELATPSEPAKTGGGGTHFLLYNTFIGESSDSGYGVDLQDGSGKLTPRENDKSVQNIQIRTLDHIIAESNFSPNFIKIDTDGFDFKVLRSGEQSITKFKPALYFEWSYQHLHDIGESATSIFPLLAQWGYEWLLIFDNFGSPLCKLSSLDSANLSLLMDYTRDSKQIHYFDVLAFHKDDNDCLQAYLAGYNPAC